MVPVKLKRPEPCLVSPPVPEMSPANVEIGFVNVRVFAPKWTPPEPAKSTMVDVVAELRSNTPLATTCELLAMLPVPVRASVPALMVVTPE